jgi:hypothetical protein
MRKLLCAVSLAAAAAFTATAAQAAPEGYYHNPRVMAPAAGVVGGTVAGVGISEGWWGSAAAAALPTTAAGAAVIGGVVGMGTIAFVDAALEPCRGFAALFDLSSGECVNGQYVGYAQPPVVGHAPVVRHRTVVRHRAVRRHYR